ncbi:hypothetical protein IH779_00330 [Patescibacteria group bacterium]|nr:hypothetical protein [Patescibacteria group bacterium]
MAEVAQISETGTEAAEAQKQGALFSPEGILMLTLAVLVDLAGLIDLIPVIGNILSYGVDIFGLIFIGGWMFFRSQTVQVTGRAAGRMGKIAKWAKKMKWLRPLLIIGEFIPIVGILPLWIIAVYFELQQ